MSDEEIGANDTVDTYPCRRCSSAIDSRSIRCNHCHEVQLDTADLDYEELSPLMEITSVCHCEKCTAVQLTLRYGDDENEGGDSEEDTEWLIKHRMDQACHHALSEDDTSIRPLADELLISLEDTTAPRAYQCKICLEDRPRGHPIMELSCGHFFDSECVRTWFSMADTCPHCSVHLNLDLEY